MLRFLFLLATAAVAQTVPTMSVVEKKAGMLAFYTSEGRRVAQAKVGTFPHEQIFSPDRKTIYVTDNGLLWMTDPGEGTNSISIIDVASRKRTGVIDLGKYRRPHSMALDAKTNRLIVTIENPNGLLLIDLNTRKIVRMFDVQGKNPHMAIFGPKAEWAYVSNTNSGEVAAIHLASGKVKLIPTGKRPQGAVMTRDERTIFVTNIDSKTISRIDTAMQKVTGEIRTTGGPARIAFTPDERVLVYNLQAEEGCAFADPAAMKELASVTIPGKPLSLSLSADGRTAFLGLQDSDKIALVSVAERKLAKVIDTPKDAGPDTILALP
ncbi:MAG: hypothetical protein HY820_04075 [Acidobacteria bacterium]|nr:hypothetical protein [Acidobacteriota bacterium]